MDSTTRAVLVEVARAVLRVLAPEAAKAPPPIQAEPTPTPAAIAQRGDKVRVWTGSMYAVGEVITICRGTPRKVKVRIARAGVRGKIVTIEAEKAQVLKGEA